MKHAPTAAIRLKGLHLRYSGKNWSDAFECPTCKDVRRYNLNFLGTRVPTCSGTGKFKLAAKASTQDDPKKRIEDALYEVDHYRELVQVALETGDLEEAEGWLRALAEETIGVLDPNAEEEAA